MSRFAPWFCALLLLSRLTARATEQHPDFLATGSKTRCVYGISIDDDFQEKLNRWKKHQGYNVVCSANWSGYVAEWKLEADKLYLQKVIVGVFGEYGDPVTVPSQKVFGKAAPIYARWVDGEVIGLPKPWLGFIPWIKTEKVYLFEKGILKKTFRRKARW